MFLCVQASNQLNLQYHVVGMEIWNLKGYTNWTETEAQVGYTTDWIGSNWERLFTDKIPFDDIILLTYNFFAAFLLLHHFN